MNQAKSRFVYTMLTLAALAAPAAAQPTITIIRNSVQGSGGFQVSGAQPACGFSETYSASASAADTIDTDFTMHGVAYLDWEIDWHGWGYIAPGQPSDGYIGVPDCGDSVTTAIAGVQSLNGDDPRLGTGPNVIMQGFAEIRPNSFTSNATAAANLAASGEMKLRLHTFAQGQISITVSAQALINCTEERFTSCAFQFRGPGLDITQSSHAVSPDSAVCTVTTPPTAFSPGEYTLTWQASGADPLGPSACDAQVSGRTHFATTTLQPIAPPSFLDPTGDGAVEIDDLFAWLSSPFDANGDGAIDADPYGDDVATYAAILGGQGNLGEDCNANGFPDAYDILVFTATSGAQGSPDENDNAVPDECDAAPCPGDANGDNLVNFADLNAVLSAFGQAGPGIPGDLNGDGAVNFTDLNVVLSTFGESCD